MYRSHPNFYVSWLRSFISSVLALTEGIVGTVSLGFITLDLETEYLFHCVKKDTKKRIERKKNG